MPAASGRAGFEDPDEVEAIGGPELRHARPVSDESGGDEWKPRVLPCHEHIPVTRPDGFDELVQVVPQKRLVERQAQSLAEREQRFQRPLAVAMRPDLRGEEVGRRRKDRGVVPVRPGREQADERPGALPAPWRQRLRIRRQDLPPAIDGRSE